jgi:carbonic anhydrase
MGKFDKFAFSAHPAFDESEVRQAFAQAVPLKTVVIYCYDPRAAQIPCSVAKRFGETFPGQLILDASGHKIASTTNIFPVIVAGGRAFDALRSVAVAQHLFGIENIVVVHHSHCGATTFTASGIVSAFRAEQHADISHTFPHETLCIADYEQSLRGDVKLLRDHPATPRSANIFGFFYEIDSGELIEVVNDLGSDGQHGPVPAE